MDFMEDEEFLNQFQGEILEGIVDLLILHSDEVSEFSSIPIGPALVMSALSAITQDEDKWMHAIQYIIRKVPSYSTIVINEMIKEIPCPTAITVSTVFAHQYEVAELHSADILYYRKVDINICAVLGCLAYKMAGVFSAEIFTDDVWNYLLRFVQLRRSPQQVLMAFLAIEKFAMTSENKIKIDAVFKEPNDNNPLFHLLEFINSQDYVEHQVGFCARWALDNTYTVPGREATYLSVNMSAIHVILSQSTSVLIKMSPDGLEVRCDTVEHSTVRAMGAVSQGAWYYEVTLITGGAMRIGFATTNADMSENYVIGSTCNSIGYDGSIKAMWINSVKQILDETPYWEAGDVVGLYLDIDQKSVYIILEDITIMTPAPDFFDDNDDCESERTYYPAVTLAPYEHCRFNFGTEPFVHVPPEANYSTFNDVCQLTAEEKMVKPKLLLQSENSIFNDSSDACIVCSDNTADTKLLPCGHSYFCRRCALKVDICPVCCADIDNHV